MKNIPILNTIALALVLVINTLANTLPINGYQTGELSAMYPNSFVPAGFTFAIWGVIYLLLLVWVLYFLFPFKEKQLTYYQTFISYWFIASCLLNTGWIIAWHYLYVKTSVIIMLGLLYSLIKIYETIYAQDRSWIIKLPFSIYLGWISVATIANATAVLVSMGIDGGQYAPYYSAMMVCIAGILGILMLLRKGDIFYVLVLLWAFYGIQAKHEILVIYYSVYAVGAILILLSINVLFKKKAYLING